MYATFSFIDLLNKLFAGPPFCHGQFLQNSAAQFVKFCKILQHYYPQIPYIPRPLGVVVLTDNISKYKEFIVSCNTKTHYIRSLMMKISSWHHVIILIIIIKVSLERLDFIFLSMPW